MEGAREREERELFVEIAIEGFISKSIEREKEGSQDIIKERTKGCAKVRRSYLDK